MNIAIILIIFLVGAMVTFLSGNRLASKVALIFSIAAAVFSVALLIQFTNGGELSYSVEWMKNPNINFSLQADGLGLTMILLTAFLLPVIIMTGVSFPGKKEKSFYSLVLLVAFAVSGAFLSSNALIYYVFWELSLIPIYFIIIYWGNGDAEKRRKATMTFFLYTFFGSLFMLAAFIYLYYKVGSFDISALYNAELTPKEQIWIFLAFFLAFAIKVPVFPFHTWQANVYQKAPLIGTMLLAGLMSKMGLYSIMRWQLPITPYASHELRLIVLILCITGVIYGSLIALKQDNLKRFFAYASLSHVGFIAAGIYSLTYDGMQGAIALMIAHAFVVVGLFFSSDVIYRRWQTPYISQMGGIKNNARYFGLCFFIILLAGISVPLSYNFIGEFAIMFGLYQLSIWYVVAIGTSMFLGAFMMLRMYQYVMLGENKTNKAFADLSKNECLIFVLLIIIILYFGIYPKPIVETVGNSLKEILFYINR